jgi:phosphotransferase system HPr-like phosphotransfer protein
MQLMMLRGRHGDVMKISACGEDARQCVEALAFLAENDFFVEDYADKKPRPDRHVERLSRLAGCFQSDITVSHGEHLADAKDLDSLRGLGLDPKSEPQFEICGDDAEQARAVLDELVKQRYYVETEMIAKGKGKSQ